MQPVGRPPPRGLLGLRHGLLPESRSRRRPPWSWTTSGACSWSSASIPPNEGMWCLPIGFAEMGETIAEAALRELHEETGVVGRVSPPHRRRFVEERLLRRPAGRHLRGGEDLGHRDARRRRRRRGLLPHRPAAAARLSLQREGHPAVRRPPPRTTGPSTTPSTASRTAPGAEMLSDSLVGFVSEHASYVARLWLADVRSSHTTIRLHAPRSRAPARRVHHRAAAPGTLAGGREHRGGDQVLLPGPGSAAPLAGHRGARDALRASCS